MAKAATTTKKTTPPPAPAPKPSTAVATTKKNEVSTDVDAELLAMAASDAGKGVSTLASDNIVPLIYILQSLSPQVLPQKQECIKPGLNGNKTAVAGNIWFRGTKELVDGEEEGLLVQLCHFRVVYIEWGPERGDGLKGRHDKRPEEATEVKDPKNPKKSAWVMPETGNKIVETREHAVLVHREDGTLEPYIIAMSGSNHNAAKMWMTAIGRKTIPGTDGVRAPLFGYLWRMKTVPKTNDEGDWFAWQIEDEDSFCKDVAAYKMARQLYLDFEAGTKRADTPDDAEATGETDENDEANI